MSDEMFEGDDVFFVGTCGACGYQVIGDYPEVCEGCGIDVAPMEEEKKCTYCDAEIGYGLCLKCNLGNTKIDVIYSYSEDEADEVYTRGLALARNGEKHDALEVWLPLAMSGDRTTIGAVIATLWLMDKVAEAKTWIVRLAQIDMEGLEALAGRLHVPFSEFQRYAAEGHKL